MPGAIASGTRAVFFDAVGTLLFPDPPAEVAYAEVARHAGVVMEIREIRTRFYSAFRWEDEIDRASGWVTSESREIVRWRRIVADVLREIPDTDVCFRILFEHFSRPSAWRVHPHTGFIVEQLRERGLTLGMASNFDSRLLTVLDGFPELAALGERLVVSASVGYRKPAKQFFREVIKLASCEPREVLYVGDDLENDYQGATAAGLDAVLIDPASKYPRFARSVASILELLD